MRDKVCVADQIGGMRRELETFRSNCRLLCSRCSIERQQCLAQLPQRKIPLLQIGPQAIEPSAVGQHVRIADVCQSQAKAGWLKYSGAALS